MLVPPRSSVNGTGITEPNGSDACLTRYGAPTWQARKMANTLPDDSIRGQSNAAAFPAKLLVVLRLVVPWTARAAKPTKPWNCPIVGETVVKPLVICWPKVGARPSEPASNAFVLMGA